MKYLPIVLIVISLLGCTKESNQSYPNICADFTIHSNWGSGWTGMNYNITIRYPDSLIINKMRQIPFFAKRTATYHLTSNEVDSLFQDLKLVANIPLKNYGFGPNKPIDHGSSFISDKLCNCSDSTSIYMPDNNEVPNELYTLMERVTRIASKYDTSKL